MTDTRYPSIRFFDETGGTENPQDTGGQQDGGQQQAGGQQDAPWYAGLPEDLHGTASKYASVEELARGYQNAQKLIGGARDASRTFQVPGQDDDGTGLREALTKLGLPKDQDGYKLEPPEGVPADTELAQAFTKTAFDLGILPKQANELFQWYAGVASKEAEAQQFQADTQHAQNLEVLQREWGDAFDQNVQTLNSAVEALGGKEFRDAINEAGLGTHPALARGLLKIGGLLREDGMRDALRATGTPDFGTPGNQTPAAIRAKAEEANRSAHEPGISPREARARAEKAQVLFAEARKAEARAGRN
ncbi:hypothetical protein [uncultured Rhodospira sp.]|uniref:hypothetical protein n=1 Tax=uncultured Rhodospira sp. TaxID=1936189 RepID=UPI002601B8E3|nr:hypothetical protein [uncultured Rhodospira sp.]